MLEYSGLEGIKWGIWILHKWAQSLPHPCDSDLNGLGQQFESIYLVGVSKKEGREDVTWKSP